MGSDDDTSEQSEQTDEQNELDIRSVLHAARWLAGSTVRHNTGKMVLISIAQVFGAVGTALGTIAVIFYIRAAVGDGTLGRINIQIESAAEPATASIFLIGVVTVIFAAAFSIWMSERAITDLALQHAARLRTLVLRLLDDPLSENWQDTSGFRRPEIEIQQIFVSRIRSMTVALTAVLALGPSLAVLGFSVAVALFIDVLAALILFPFVVIFAVISERLNRRVQSLTATYEGRQDRTREVIAEQLEELFAKRQTPEQVSTTRVATDDQLFHARQLESTKLRLLGIANSALLFAVTAAFFILVRGVENLAIEQIIAYIFAIRFAARSGEQIIKALAQVSRRYEDIQAVSRFFATIDDVRQGNFCAAPSDEAPDELVVRLDGSEIAISRGEPAIVLSGQPVTDTHAASLLRVISEASNHPDFDLSAGSRIVRGKHAAAQQDILGTAQTRVVITDNPEGISPSGPDEFVFIMHNRPKLLLSSSTRRAAKDLGPGLVIQNGSITWAGSINAVADAEDKIRSLLARRSVDERSARTRATKDPVQR